MHVNPSTLHHAIVASLVRLQRAPTVKEIATLFDTSEAAARHGLRRLADDHGVVLHPHSDEIWVAHPFSTAPTTFLVTSGGRKWWGNCAWCSLGVAHIVGGTARIETRLGGLADPITVRIVSGELLDTDYVVHFPIPMRRAWENVIYTCSVMLMFRDERQVDDWCTTRGIAKGDVRPLAQVWPFAVEWYGRHANADWRKWSTREAAAIFRRHGLAGPVWALGANTDRF